MTSGSTPDWRLHGVRIVRGDELDLNTPQTPGMTRAAAITHASAGANKLWAGTVTVHPNAKIVVMDNLTAHKGERVRELIEERGCELLYLPPYSPDLNPIEGAFAKIKGILRKAEGRSREALIEAMGRALDAITPQDAQSFFRHCGYLSLRQPL